MQHLCPSWSKGFDSSSNIFVCAGSNPVECILIFNSSFVQCVQVQYSTVQYNMKHTMSTFCSRLRETSTVSYAYFLSFLVSKTLLLPLTSCTSSTQPINRRNPKPIKARARNRCFTYPRSDVGSLINNRCVPSHRSFFSPQ